MADPVYKQYSPSPLIPAFAAFTMLALIYLTLEASFLAREGKLAEAAILGNAATSVIFFIVAGSLVVLAVKTNLITKIQDSEIDVYGQTVRQSARDFLLGFIAFYLIGIFAPVNSVFNFSILATGDDPLTAAASVSTPYWANFITTLASPVAEEYLFFIALPIIILMLLRTVFKNGVLSNIYLQYAIAGLATSFAFAAFHIGKVALIQFFIAAMLFRFIYIMFKTDTRLDNIKGVGTGLVFAIGGHIANNIAATGGLAKWFGLMVAPPDAFAIFTSVFAVAVIGTAMIMGINQIVKQLTRRSIVSGV